MGLTSNELLRLTNTTNDCIWKYCIVAKLFFFIRSLSTFLFYCDDMQGTTTTATMTTTTMTMTTATTANGTRTTVSKHRTLQNVVVCVYFECDM